MAARLSGLFGECSRILPWQGSYLTRDGSAPFAPRRLREHRNGKSYHNLGADGSLPDDDLFCRPCVGTIYFFSDPIQAIWWCPC